MASPCGNPAGREAATIPSQRWARGGAVLPQFGAVQPKAPGESWAGPGSPSASAPGPTLSQDSRFTAWSGVKGRRCEGTGQSTARRQVVASTSLLRWCRHDCRNVKL